MVSKYIQSILLISEQPLTQSNEGTCTFNDVFTTPLGNTRPCTSTSCSECTFSKSTSLKETNCIISYEQISTRRKD